MPNLDAVLEIATSSEELKLVLLPFISKERHEVAWHGVEEFLRTKNLKEETVLAVSWAKVLYGIPLENQQADLFSHFEKLENKVREAITRAIAIRYEPRR